MVGAKEEEAWLGDANSANAGRSSSISAAPEKSVSGIGIGVDGLIGGDVAGGGGGGGGGGEGDAGGGGGGWITPTGSVQPRGFVGCVVVVVECGFV